MPTTWTPPRTWVANDYLHASDLDTDLRDAMTFLHDPPAVRLFSVPAFGTGVQDLASGVLTVVKFTAVRFDLYGMFDGQDTVTIPFEGRYFVFAHMAFSGISAVGRRNVQLLVNNMPIASIQDEGNANGNGLSCYTHYRFGAGNKLQVGAYQDSGGNLPLLTSNGSVEFGAVWIGSSAP